MAGFSNYLEGLFMDWLFEGSAIATKANVYVSLHTGDPGDTGANEKAVAGSYARVTAAPASWQGTEGARENSAEIAFPAASADWGTITYFGLWDAASAGNFLGGGSLSLQKLVYNGDQLKFTSGNLDYTLD